MFFNILHIRSATRSRAANNVYIAGMLDIIVKTIVAISKAHISKIVFCGNIS